MTYKSEMIATSVGKIIFVEMTMSVVLELTQTRYNISLKLEKKFAKKKPLPFERFILQFLYEIGCPSAKK